jgi:glycosyltransferase involved in cell wall biosynthesis
MKILLVHNSYMHYGGEDRAFELEYEALIRLLGEEQVRKYVVSSRNSRPWEMLRALFFSRRHYKKVYRIIKEENIDIVHVHNFFPVLTTSVFKATKNAGAGLVHTLHNYRWWCVNGLFYREGAGICTLCTRRFDWWSAIRYRCYRGSGIQTIAARLAFWYYKRTGSLSRVDLFFVLTAFQRLLVIAQGLNPDKIALKPHWSTPAKYIAESERSGVVFIGRLESSKGIVQLLEIWQSLPPQNILTVIGTGNLEDQLKQQYAHVNNIRFTGNLEPEETLDYLASARFSIQASLLYETFGLTILESMQAGVPVIGFNIGTRAELIRNEINGFLASPGEMKATIEKALLWPDYSGLCAGAMQTAKEFQKERLLGLQIEYYHKVNELRT